MSNSDVFVYPAIRDSGAGALIEAMYTGLACIASDYGPMSELIDEGRGIKVPLNYRQEHIDGFQYAMEKLVLDSKMREKIGLSAHQFAADYFTWKNRAKAILEVYKWILGTRKNYPSCIFNG